MVGDHKFDRRRMLTVIVSTWLTLEDLSIDELEFQLHCKALTELKHPMVNSLMQLIDAKTNYLP